jgi:UDP-N-acetylmuramate dehydrogenase
VNHQQIAPFIEEGTMTPLTHQQWGRLASIAGERLQRDVPLARLTAARVGGCADALVTVESVDQLSQTITRLWEAGLPTVLLGGGSNVLVSDAGVREVVVLNQAKAMRLDVDALMVWAASGASFGQMARKVSARGYHGLEWAAGIPGSVGGAVYGNAGAHGGDVAGNLCVAEILHPSLGRVSWQVDQMGYGYRSSLLKREATKAVILSASFGYQLDATVNPQELVATYAAQRKRTQPPGASMGSMFKNPPGDHAGRLIEQAGLKGTRIGGAEISLLHANFFICHAGTRAADILALIQLVQQRVADQFGIELSLEIELLGEWEAAHA